MAFDFGMGKIGVAVGQQITNSASPLTILKARDAPQLEQLAEFIKHRNAKCQGGRLTGEDVVHYIYTEFGVQYHLHHAYKILKQLGFSWITSRSKHPKQSIQDQESFKKLPTGNDPSHTGTPFS